MGFSPLHTNGKEKNGTTSNIKDLHASFHTVLPLRMEMDPDSATDSFKYTP